MGRIMKVLKLIFILFLASVSMAVNRPPALSPADVPFAYDVNMVASDVLAWTVTEPNVSVIFRAKVRHKWGLGITFAAVDCYDANTPILVNAGLKVPDVNDGGWIQDFDMVITPLFEGVHYVEMTAVNKLGRAEDKRTLLILCAVDEPPIIFTDDKPVISTREAQRLWQVAKKKGYPVTKPTRVAKL